MKIEREKQYNIDGSLSWSRHLNTSGKPPSNKTPDGHQTLKFVIFVYVIMIIGRQYCQAFPGLKNDFNSGTFLPMY